MNICQGKKIEHILFNSFSFITYKYLEMTYGSPFVLLPWATQILRMGHCLEGKWIPTLGPTLPW